MDFDAIDLSEPSTFFWGLAGAMLLLACWAVLAEHRRTRRRDLDKPGWVPWTLVQVLAFLLAVAAAALALKA